MPALRSRLVTAIILGGNVEVPAGQLVGGTFKHTLGAVFPSLLKTASTPWVSYPGLYTARCEQSDGASWLNVTKATGPADPRPIVTEDLGPAWGYHLYDLGLAQDNLVSDVAAAEITWTHDHP